MSEQEVNLDPEVDGGSARKDEPEGEIKVEEGGGQSEQDLSGNQNVSSAEDGSPESKLKPKKAQRTHRIQLIGPQMLANHETPTKPSSQPANEGEATNENNQSNQSNAFTSHQPPAAATAAAGDCPVVSAATPVQIPPQIIAFCNDGDCLGEGVYGKESSAILSSMCCVASGLVRVVRGAGHFLAGLFRSLMKLMFTPSLLGAVLYCALIYVLVYFVADHEDHSQVEGFEAALKYVLRNATWIVLPVFASFLVIHFNSNTKHHQFLYESVVDSSLMFVNSLIMTCHASAETLLWLGPVFLVAALFRLVYWISLFHMQPKWQQVFRMPTILNCIVLSMYNLGMAIQTYAGRYLDAISGYGHWQPADVAPTHDSGSVESSTSGQDERLFNPPSVCQIAEKIFCGVDGVQ